VQGAELHHQEEPPQRPRPDGAEEVLPALPPAHLPPGDALTGIDPALAGRVYPPSPAYEVGREKIREFAEAVGAGSAAHRDPQAARDLGYPDVIAPPTFAVIIAQRSAAQLVEDPSAGVDYSRVLHGEERFVHHRPIIAGDRLVATLHVESVRSAGGHDMLVTRVEIADGAGDPVSTATSTLVVRGR
jgi:acyl dehydratase